MSRSLKRQDASNRTISWTRCRFSRTPRRKGFWYDAGMRQLRLMLVVAAVAATTLDAQGPPARFDVLIRGGRIVDGTGAPWYRGDVAIAGDRIAAVGPSG